MLEVFFLIFKYGDYSEWSHLVFFDHSEWSFL